MVATTPLHNEYELLQRVADGDEQAFRQLFDGYWDTVFSVAFTYTKSAPLSEEIVQDVFVKLWLKREQLRTIERFDAWLFIIARNHIYNALRTKTRETAFTQHLAEYFQLAATTPDDQLIGKEAGRLLQEAVDQLPAQQQAVYRLSRQQGLTHEEIALQLNISKNTVKVHMNKALAFIRTYMELHLLLAAWIWMK